LFSRAVILTQVHLSISSQFFVKLLLETQRTDVSTSTMTIRTKKGAAERTYGQHETRISSFQEPGIDVGQHTSFPVYHPQIRHGTCEGRRQDSRPLLLCGRNVPCVYSHRASAARKFRHAAPGN